MNSKRKQRDKTITGIASVRCPIPCNLNELMDAVVSSNTFFSAKEYLLKKGTQLITVTPHCLNLIEFGASFMINQKAEFFLELVCL